MDALECVKGRRSVRDYTEQDLDKDAIKLIVDAGIWAPSGKNGQPWRFKIVTDKEDIKALSDLSVYGSWMRKAPCFIVIFLDKLHSYNYIKDVQSCGAVMQNMMLAAHAVGIGSCWIGEILPKAEEVKQILEIKNCNMELIGIITLGYAKSAPINVGRKNEEYFLL